MKNTEAELLDLWEKYDGNSEKILEEHVDLGYLYALSKARENLLEWFPFQPGKKILVDGADCGSLAGLFLQKGLEVTVLDDSADQLAFTKTRWPKAACIQGRLSGSLEALKGRTGKVDYICIAGSLEEEEEARNRQIKNARKLLAPGGYLFVAADNPSGLKPWAGAPKEANASGRKRLKKLLEKGQKDQRGELTMYYPFPDHKLPTEIYSDSWLPEKGDLSGAVISYDYPEFLKAETGPSYDMICEEGNFREFSNSFLAVWRKGGWEE